MPGFRAGRVSPVDQSAICYETMTMAHRAGQVVFKLFVARLAPVQPMLSKSTASRSAA
jgi:hypothetical protein